MIVDVPTPAATPALAPHPAFAVEFAFTAAHQRTVGWHPASREAACLAAFFPGALAPIEAGDRLAGRLYASPGVGKPFRVHGAYRRPYAVQAFNMTTVGFTTLRPGWTQHVGYFCDEGLLRRKIEEVQPGPDVVAALEELMAYWRAHSTATTMRRDYPERIATELPFDRFEQATEAHPAYPLYRLTGPMMAFDVLVQRGIPGLRADVRDRLARAATAGDDEARALCVGLEGYLDVLVSFCRHYAAEARTQATALAGPARADRLRLASLLERLPEAAPARFDEALQLILLYATLSNAFSFGRLDVALGPILAADLDSGRLSEAEALELTKSAWQIIADCGAPFDNRVIIGGRGRPDPVAADRFARLAIEATRQVKEPLPQLSLRFDPAGDRSLLEQGLVALGEGRTFPMLYNDAVNVPAVAAAMGVSEAEAEQYVPYGCGEYVLWKRSFGTPSGFINVAKVLECVLRGGREPLSGRRVGPQSPGLEGFANFEEFYGHFEQALRHWVAVLAEQQAFEYTYCGQTAAFLGYTLLYDNCLERGRAAFSGGIAHLGGTLESYGQINAGDCLAALRELVFETREVEPAALLRALDANFAGHEPLRRRLLRAPKYGNDDPRVDELQVRLHRSLCLATQAEARRVGLDSYLIVIINNLMNAVLGRITGAMPDGRRLGEALANANNPSSGQDRSGTTAFLNSLVKLETRIHAGAVQNMKFSPDLFRPGLRPKFDALLDGYWAQGGAQAMITVVNPGDLEAALCEPEKYADLMVRVGGFSARFVDLPRDCQEEILHRTLNA